jgi:hypothetical protein
MGLFIVSPTAVLGDRLQFGEPLPDVAELGGAQSHLENRSRGAHPRAFRELETEDGNR